MKKKLLIIIILIIAIFSTCSTYYRYRLNKSNNDIKNLINEVVIYKNGYDSYIKNFVSKQAFEALNSPVSIFNNNPDIKKPLKVSVESNKIKRHEINGKKYIYMIYDIRIYDSKKKLVSAALDTPLVYTVTQNKDHLYIEKIQEYENENQVPKIYK
ncbi:hypothetical protein CPAST_c03980 [Clostridium pasteurianum DSM 525 = ATCC 6013]|jgi:hypothetical protein|uniref:Uncharacterized protein n=1 Tax=Clostridium pasteurianum DSM 525 = ATCC 6013 TaxID=1262449 RepID=A0A0H3J3K9_CLOPA|nr:hypothetical protein [Clostridium pasteurianum]AJA46498.1 hypothetical protein CPAST_c03980 [Clostridium pasteurianum DSM 525 = ATCC 6013]AJA50486.1 hypothetical protein CLPA_c03980 [Clostridium pasteurianum DSM 525 = ATCC 6013]AOZ73924.1 hypothetical protein AQ983_01925 [Clostridium pasteurianum DSM 525 = ATCC 6013]AOZ77721.1 hypothetical protein AQ984_01925 [Clostridium pasteurianum]ELP61070.1 hypothetical protein F502_01405 [Clostridium pasteurianum DSM 525 = ATCC 6013]